MPSTMTPSPTRPHTVAVAAARSRPPSWPIFCGDRRRAICAEAGIQIVGRSPHGGTGESESGVVEWARGLDVYGRAHASGLKACRRRFEHLDTGYQLGSERVERKRRDRWPDWDQSALQSVAR